MKFIKQIALMLVFMLATLSLFGCAKEPEPAEVVSDPTSSIVEPEQKSGYQRYCLPAPPAWAWSNCEG